jgi:aldehyde:ferredoxin oxidoreductase
MLSRCLHSIDFDVLADTIAALSRQIRKLRWKTRLATGFDPMKVAIPKCFTEVTTWKGKIDEGFMDLLKEESAKRIIGLRAEPEEQP